MEELIRFRVISCRINYTHLDNLSSTKFKEKGSFLLSFLVKYARLHLLVFFQFPKFDLLSMNILE
jgi:hypothetical protein